MDVDSSTNADNKEQLQVEETNEINERKSHMEPGVVVQEPDDVCCIFVIFLNSY